jgi:biopolymer transport protein ExbB
MTSNALLDFFVQGGLAFMLPLLALSILSLAVLLERTFFLVQQERRFRRFAQLCEGTPDAEALAACWSREVFCIAGIILHDAGAAVAKFGGALTYEAAIEKTAGKYTILLTQRLWMLRAIGQIAPFIGLTGTVVGLAIAFRGIAESGITQQSVARGIAIALNTTIMGLIIALPTLFGEHTLRACAQSQFQRISSFLDAIMLRLGAKRA